MAASHHERPGAHIFASPGLVADAGDLPAGAAPHRSPFRPCVAGLRRRPSSWLLLLLLLLHLLMLDVEEVVADAGALRGQGQPAHAEPLKGAVEKLGAAGDRRYHPHGEVEAEEDGLLRGAGGEAVHRVGAGEAAAGELGLHLEAVQPPLACQEAEFCEYAERHIDDVHPPQMEVFPVHPPAISADFRASVPLVVVMHDVHEEDQRRRGDEDDVEHPESVLGDGEGHVVAHLLAARLQGVAGELLLLVIEQVAGDGSQDQNPKDKHEQEPETAEHRRVGLEAVKESAEEAPFAHDFVFWIWLF